MENYVHNAEKLPVIFKHKLVDYQGVMLHEDYASMMPEVESLRCSAQDILLASFQKSGGTWMDSILTLTTNNGDPDSLVEEEVGTGKYKPTFIIEFRWSSCPGQGDFKFLDLVKKIPPPKTMRTHLPYQLLPLELRQNNSKIIYVYRNVKDVMVSLYYHYKYHPSKIVDRLGTFVEFAEDFMKGEVADGPYFGHLHSYWTHRHDANVLFIAYEAMLEDHRGTVRKIATFLDKPLSEAEIDNIVFHSSKDQMVANNDKTWRRYHTAKDANGELLHQFIRTGTAGKWKSEFSDELSAKTDAWIAESLHKYGFESNPFQ